MYVLIHQTFFYQILEKSQFVKLPCYTVLLSKWTEEHNKVHKKT